MAKSGRPDARSRRGFLKAAAAAAAATATTVALGEQPTTTRPATDPTTAPATRRGRPAPPPLPLLGNAEPPAVQFQACPGGTAAYLQRLVQQRGAAAFDRVIVTPVEDPAPLPTTEEEIAFLPVHKLAGHIKAGRLSAVELTRIYLDRLKALDPVLLCAVTILDGPGDGRRRAGRPGHQGRSLQGPAARHPVGGEGPVRRTRGADHLGGGRVQGPRDRRRRRGGPPAGRRRGDPDRQAGNRQVRPGRPVVPRADQQPVEPQGREQRVVGGAGVGHGRGVRGVRHRDRDPRVNRLPCRHLRFVRPAAHVRPRQPGRRHDPRLDHGPRRPAVPDR